MELVTDDVWSARRVPKPVNTCYENVYPIHIAALQEFSAISLIFRGFSPTYTDGWTP